MPDLSTTPLPELFQMRFSMYPEMSRWALDFKSVPHIRQSVLPGPHAPKILRLARQTSMPVFRHRGQLVCDSARVLDYIEEQWPEPRLYPPDAVERQRAIEIRDRCRKWGPHIRRAMFYALLKNNDYAASLISQGYPVTQQQRYRRFFGLVKMIMRLSMGITAKRSAASQQIVGEALDWLAANINEHGYLIGEQFTVADLAAAAVVMPTSLAEGTPAAAPLPRPPELQAWVGLWAGHPAVEWAEKMYRDHRPDSAAVEDRAY